MIRHGEPVSMAMEKHWQCPECDRRFAREADLRRHIRNMHYIVRRPAPDNRRDDA